jgi:FHS family glucose/mannose:H+ symporter-like MFS transporter
MAINAFPPAPGSTSMKGTAFVHIDFVLTGIVMTLLGPMLPVFSRQWLLNDTQAGYLFVAQWVSATVGMYFSGICVQRYGYRKTLMAGLALMVVGIAGLGRAHWVLGMICVCIFGVGTGVNTPAANLMTAEINPTRSAAALNLLNSSWGVGAMVCPFIVAAAVREHRTSFFLYGLAGALVALTVTLASVGFAADQKPSEHENSSSTRSSLWTLRLTLVATLFFLYVGTETAVGGWIASYARRIDPQAKSLWAIMPSFFWGTLLIGRALAPIVLRYLRATSLAKAGLTCAAFGVGILLAAHSIAIVVIGAGVAGLGLASIFPINVSLLPHWFGSNTRRSSGVIFSVSNFGGAALGWLVGALSSHFGSLRIGFLVPLVGAIGMLVFYLSPAAAPDTAN